MRHPLDPLTADEIDAARAILVEADLLGDTVRMPMLLPHEPDKDELAAWTPGSVIERRVDVTLLDAATGAVQEAIVSVTGGTVLEHRELDATSARTASRSTCSRSTTGPPSSLKASPEWRAAMTRRGLADRIDLAFCSPLAPGSSRAAQTRLGRA